MKNSVIFEGGIDKVSTLADGSLRIYIGTPELSFDTMVNVFSLVKKTGYVLISTNTINQDQIDAVEKATTNAEFSEKTPSQRMRGVLYKIWEKTQPKTMNGNGEMEYVDFDLFYKRQMNKIIDHFKTKLD
jgi:phage-related tail fiber protein